MKRNQAIFRTIGCTVLVLLLAAGPVRAEVKPIDPSKIQDIKKLLDLIRLEEVVMLAAENTLKRFFPILKKATAQNNQSVSETVFAILKGSTLAMVKRQISAKDGLIDRVVPLYNKHYTHNEIRTLIRFYETPLGKKVTALRPQIAQEGMVVAEEWINFLEPLLVQALAKRLEKEGYAIIKTPSG
ncbi:MAG: DUF2059 domain-containing protein [Deltaproteobacteria bacterium]|nr:DUF2059 domain-containing protein [Deltaproteobacteria bacterium]